MTGYRPCAGGQFYFFALSTQHTALRLAYFSRLCFAIIQQTPDAYIVLFYLYCLIFLSQKSLMMADRGPSANQTQPTSSN